MNCWSLVAVVIMLPVCLAFFYRPRSAAIGQRITKRWLNRILFEESELSTEDNLHWSARLAPDDNRCRHITSILKLADGAPIKCGVLNKGITDNGRVTFQQDQHVCVYLGDLSALRSTARPRVSLVLALPRPPRLEWILPVATCLGVRSIALVNAKKVEKGFFGSHLLREPETMRELLIDGLSQAGADCHVPEVTIQRSLRHFLQDSLPALTSERCLKLIAHPPMPSDGPSSKSCIQFHELFQQAAGQYDHVLLAVGPEGGWDKHEVAMFADKGFQVVSLGPRILRTDVAVSVLLGMINEWLAR